MTDNRKYEGLKLENQLCFPLYAASREVVKRYRPFLEPLDLTYTQYIAMMVFWEQKKCSVKELGERLYLDSGTLTPVLKSLEAKGEPHSLPQDPRRPLRVLAPSCDGGLPGQAFPQRDHMHHQGLPRGGYNGSLRNARGREKKHLNDLNYNEKKDFNNNGGAGRPPCLPPRLGAEEPRRDRPGGGGP